MKKAISILSVLLLLTASLQFIVATHYCNGKEVSTTVSLSGKLVSCDDDMGCSESELPLTGKSFTKHCCNDLVTFCGIDNNYTFTFSFVPEAYQFNFQVLALPVGLSVNSNISLIPLYTNVSPPGVLMSTNVDLFSICVFRI